MSFNPEYGLLLYVFQPDSLKFIISYMLEHYPFLRNRGFLWPDQPGE